MSIKKIFYILITCYNKKNKFKINIWYQSNVANNILIIIHYYIYSNFIFVSYLLFSRKKRPQFNTLKSAKKNVIIKV